MTAVYVPAGEAQAAPAPELGHGKARKELLAASIGGVVEGYDWTIYAVMAPYFAAQMFPGSNPMAQVLAAYAGFAVGFIARPLGSILIGRLADRKGRRLALVVACSASPEPISSSPSPRRRPRSEPGRRSWWWRRGL